MLKRCRYRFALVFCVLAACGDGTGVIPPDMRSDDGVVDAPDASVSDDASMSDGGDVVPTTSCDDVPAVGSTALSFSGDTRVAMGPAPELGLETFTLEAWVRRTGRGDHAGTGVGGLRIVPIISKGRGESDGTNLDCNYSFGFHGDVLGADFEDMESGANHPVSGKTPVREGEWNHVAATYDGATWRLYLNGQLDAERTVDATPRFDSIQHFGLGAGWNSEGTDVGGFVGQMAQVRVYSRALDESEIMATMNSSTPNTADLVAHYPLDEDDATAAPTVRDRTGTVDGTLISGTYVTGGPFIDQGTRPTLIGVEDSPGTLSVDAIDADGDALTVEFYTRTLTDEDDFTIVVLPDSQYYTRNANPPGRPDADDPNYFYSQTQWAMDHVESDNIVGVVHVGDIVNNADVSDQWDRASNAFAILEEPTARFPEGLPYALSYGNHDQYERNVPGATAEANAVLGLDRFGDKSWFGGSYKSDKADENWVSFWVGELQVIVVSLQFNPEPSARVLEWARNVLESHPHALGIVNSHYIVTGGGNFSDQGEVLYEAFKDIDNLQLMTSGHVAHAARRSDDFEGNVIHSMLQDYQRTAIDPDDPTRPVVVAQSLTNGGHGFMRIFRFSPREQKLHVETYSPFLDHYFTNDDNKFSLDLDIVRAGGEFSRVATVPVESGRATTSITNTADEAVEWYAVVRDCQHAVQTDISRVDQ